MFGSSRWDCVKLFELLIIKCDRQALAFNCPKFLLWTAHYHCSIQHFFLSHCDRQYSYSSWIIAFLAESMACRHEKKAVLSQLYLSCDYTKTVKQCLLCPSSSQVYSQLSPQTSLSTLLFCESFQCPGSWCHTISSSGRIPNLDKKPAELVNHWCGLLNHSFKKLSLSIYGVQTLGCKKDGRMPLSPCVNGMQLW